ncbi:hypothetical protein [Streptomyces fildesensis]|uniref:hypothetical protein n=1 Tax=Streptomyces fildesensis TaxID=375757 RepID=UPI001E64623C|nr:hypothetical protein [Streptomyces fildesensis]
MPVQTALPSPHLVAEAAVHILQRLEDDHEFPAFHKASLNYSDDWQCFTGFPVISKWKLEDDAPPLFVEAMRALALKAAVYALTEDEKAAEIAIAVPVDEMTHAMLAQSQLLHRIADCHAVSIIHQTDQEHTDYRHGDYTHQCYTAAWGEPPARYWLDHQQVEANRAHLAGLYASIGIGRSGREHTIAFAPAA